MWHDVLISGHAILATVALLAGLAARPSGRFYRTYRWSQLGMTVTLVLAIAAGWSGYGPVARIAFPALAALAAVMVVRAFLAGRMLPADAGGPRGATSTTSASR
jgi:hypothetical protein